MPSNQLIHPNPNFIVNSIKGWNTRLIFNYYGSQTPGDFDYYNYNGNYTNNLLSSIENWASSQSIIASKGVFSFPSYSRFFKTGKTIRIKGYLQVSSTDSNSIFNMYAKIINLTSSISYDIAATNKFNNHIFASANIVNNVPVNFEIIYKCVETSDPALYFQANGFYQYNINTNGNTGTNDINAYVPVFDNVTYVFVGSPEDEYRLHLSFDGSVNINPILLRHLTIEEL